MMRLLKNILRINLIVGLFSIISASVNMEIAKSVVENVIIERSNNNNSIKDSFIDSNSLQSMISGVVSEIGADVVYCGKAAADTGAGSTGPGIAERLGWASVSNIISATFADNVSVVAPAQGGNARISVTLPAVISCDKGNIKVRKPNVRGIMQAKKAQVDVKSVSAPASSISVMSHSLPPSKPAGKTYEGGESAAEVAQLLRDEANVI